MPTQPGSAVRSSLFLRLAIGYVYLHFGLLKFFPDLSPAESIATQTVMALTMNILDASTALFCLAILETVIGLGLIFNSFPRLTFGMFMFHMFGSFLPIFLFPTLAFKIAPFAPSLEGQYIFKNVVFVAAGWTVLMPESFAKRKTEYSMSDQLELKRFDRTPRRSDRVGYEEAIA